MLEYHVWSWRPAVGSTPQHLVKSSVRAWRADDQLSLLLNDIYINCGIDCWILWHDSISFILLSCFFGWVFLFLFPFVNFLYDYHWFFIYCRYSSHTDSTQFDVPRLHWIVFLSRGFWFCWVGCVLRMADGFTSLQWGPVLFPFLFALWEHNAQQFCLLVFMVLGINTGLTHTRKLFHHWNACLACPVVSWETAWDETVWIFCMSQNICFETGAPCVVLASLELMILTSGHLKLRRISMSWKSLY